ncbi:MAG TPA: glycoside hydrolase family 3 N-terminal domain-containing protein [Aggregatilineales bacterium]|nr:glycoside hydrolase family 3 protein [Anaerolineales bacterium]HRE49140.1 glycoside hydrolase family 3 N-terminal domain-containing protein [Aggregatilineales bacterium]
MKRAARLLCLILSVGVLWNGLAHPPLSRADDGTEEVALAARVEAILGRMSREEIVGQLFMVSVPGTTLAPDVATFLHTLTPGAIVMFSANGRSPELVTNVINAWQSVALKSGGRVPYLIASDHEGGAVMRLREGFTALPYGAALGAMPPEMAAVVGGMAAAELRAVGVTLNLAPVADVRAAAERPYFVEPRTFGYEPERVGGAVAGYVRGLQTGGVIGTLKHFPGHGAAGDSHSFLPVLNHSRSDLETIDLVPFKAGIAAGAEVIMVGHLSVPSLDPTPGLPATLSKPITTDLLRGELGFQGVILTDAMDMGAVVDNFTATRAGVLALQAGATMLAIGPKLDMSAQLAMKQAILDAIARGALSDAQVTDSARRILLLKGRYGLLDWTPLDPETASVRVNSADHSARLEALYEQTVAFAYDDFGVLPLTPEKRVAWLYPVPYGDVRTACLAYGSPVANVAYALDPSEGQISAAAQIAAQADLTIVFTADMERHPRQADLVNALPPEKTIVIALANPYDFERGIAPGAYGAVFNPTPPAYRAICGALYGRWKAGGTFEVVPG